MEPIRPAHAELLRIIGRYVKQAFQIERCIGFEVESVAGLIVRVGDELVEFVILRVGDILFVHCPYRSYRVHQLSVQTQRKSNKARIPLDYAVK